MTDEQIQVVRLEAAQMEREASRIRLQTAQREAESAERTLAMADAIANAMFSREVKGHA